MSKDIKLQLWALDRIKPYAQNVKLHTKEQIERIAQSLGEFGWDQPIVVDKDGVIIKGHGRRLAALHLGWKEAPVWQRSDLSEPQARAARLADNRVAIGDVDPELLRKELADLEFDLTGIFDTKELEFLKADITALSIDAFVPNISDEAKAAGDESAAAIIAADERPVPVAGALGFKTVPGAKQRAVARFMAKIEAQFNLPPQEAFVAFIESVVKEPI